MRVVVAAAALFLAVFGTQAFAKIQICNRFEHPIHIAIAFELNGVWVSSGWMTVDTDKCQIDTAHPDVTSFYYRGETDTFAGTQWSWGAGREFAVKAGNFTVRNADQRQADARFVKFSGPNTYKLPSTTVLLEFRADLRVTFVVPAENPEAASRAAILDAARDACEKKSGDVAIQGCTDLIKSEPNNAVAYYNRGIEYEGKRQYDLAIADYSKAIDIKPDYGSAYNNRGSIYFNRLDDVSHAIADFTKAIDLNPKFALALDNRGNVYRMIGANSVALGDLSAAIEANPKLAIAIYHRGRAYEALGRKAEAVADLRRALAINPGDANSKDALKRLGETP